MKELPTKDKLITAMDILERAEKQEAAAREREERKYDPAKAVHCDFEWGGVDCHQCEELPECSLHVREYQDETAHLFTEALDGYREALPIIREAVEVRNDEASWLLLSRVLMDIDIHPVSMEQDIRELFWEAQYCFLHLYYTTGNLECLEQAKLCEACRHATVTAIE